jgi:hypothetical protein
MKRAVGSWYTSAWSRAKLDACMPGVSIDHESNHNARVSAAPDKICGGTKSGSGPTESVATVRSGNTSYAFIALRWLLGIMPFHINRVCSFCFYISLTTREFIVEKPQISLKRHPSYNGFGNQSLAVSFRKSRILYHGGLCGIRGGVVPSQIFLTFGFPLSFWFHHCSTFILIYHRYCLDIGSDRVADSVTDEWNI